MSRQPTARSWHGAEQLARQQTDTAIKLPKRSAPLLPQKYESAPRSLPKGENAVYRSPGPRAHFQVREYDDHWTVDFDEFHPQHYPVQHAVKDSAKETAVAAIAAGAVVGSYFG